MDYTTLLPEVKEAQEPTQTQVQSLYDLCQQLVDGRAARGKRYDLAGILVVLVLAKLAGMKSLLGASEWIKHQAEVLRAELPLSWTDMPCTNTYSYVLARLNSQEINAALAAWFVRQAARSRQGEGSDTGKSVARSIWRLMAKLLEVQANRPMEGTTRNNMCCMSMRCKPGLCCSSVPLARSATR